MAVPHQAVKPEDSKANPAAGDESGRREEDPEIPERAGLQQILCDLLVHTFVNHPAVVPNHIDF
jgi:hypothetical protein